MLGVVLLLIVCCILRAAYAPCISGLRFDSSVWRSVIKVVAIKMFQKTYIVGWVCLFFL